MRCFLTGAAGFIGSSTVDRLLADGHEVVGIDKFVPYYPRHLKEKNIAAARDSARYTFIERDICEILFKPEGSQCELLDGVDVIFHQAAQAGVRASWGADFQIYTHNNILSTQILLEAARAFPRLRVVCASSSSVYGETVKFPSSPRQLR